MYPAQQNATDQSTNFFWLLVLIFMAAIAVWWLDKSLLVSPIFWLRSAEITVIQDLVMAYQAVARLLHLPVPSVHNLGVLQKYIATTPMKEVKVADFNVVNVIVGHWMRWPAAALLFGMAAVMHFRHGANRFTQKYTMQNLKKLESANWPQIKPVLSVDLVKTDIEKGPWAMAKRPLDFCKEHQLISVTNTNGKDKYIVNKNPAQRIFAMQLGAMWQGPEALPIYLKAILVVCLARADRKRDIANKLLAQISGSAASGKLDFSGVEEHLKTFKKSGILPWLSERHAYVATYMSTLLEIARTDGVLATSEFLWLKPVDRRMWYVLNSVGRQTSVIEVAGVFAHWKAEKKVGRALKAPMIKEAVKALDLAVADILYIPEGAKWHSNAV